MIENLTTYIPMDRRQALANGRSLPEQTSGIALFADISGFTPLTGTLAKELGPQRGAEELLSYINPIYEALITELHRYRGSVISFAGDSITCWFDDETTTAARALTCALAMQQAMTQFAEMKTANGTPLTIAVKIALAAGQARRLVVGDPAIHRIDTLVGTPLDEVARAEHLTSKGEVTATASVLDFLDETAVAITEWRQEEHGDLRAAVIGDFTTAVAPNPWPPLAEDAIPLEIVQQWLLPPIYKRLQSGGSFLAELRPTVPIFVKFVGLDYDQDDDVGRKLDAYIRWVQTVATHYKGHVLQLTVGDKGSYLYLGFGAPVAYEDDALRAVAAALELRTPPPELDFIHESHIGLSQGLMWCGAYGAGARRAYSVMGSETNMAARLMSMAASGQALVSQHLAESVEQSYNLHYLGLFSVKGRATEMGVSEALSRKQATAVGILAQYESALIEREDELAQLNSALTNTAAGKGQIVRLVGETGIGKSHLTAVFARSAHAQNYRVSIGRCLSITQSIAYVPWRQILHSLLGLTTEESDGTNATMLVTQLEGIIQQMNPDWLVRLPLLGDLLGLPIPDNPATAVLDARLRQESLIALVVAICQQLAAQQPLVLIFEDIHWLDDASAALTTAVARALSTHPILLLIVHRPQPSNEAEILPTLTELPSHQQIVLRELSTVGVVHLVDRQLLGEVSPLIPALIAAKTAGNPLFVEEMVDTLRESEGIQQTADDVWELSPTIHRALYRAGCLEEQEGGWRLVEEERITAVDLGIPDSIQGIVLARIDHLHEEHKMLLKVASVIGQQFNLSLAHSAHPPIMPNLETMQDSAQILNERDFIRPETTNESNIIYVFHHSTTQEVAYATLLFAQRQQLHRTVCNLLQQSQPDNVPALAYHAFWGEDWERALRYDLQAGRQARKLFANKEAVIHLQRAQESASHLSGDNFRAERLELAILLGEILVQLGRYEEATTELEAGLILAEELADDDGYVEVCRWLARRWEFTGQYDQAWQWIERGLARLPGQQSAAITELLATAGFIHSRQGDQETAQELAESALQMAELLQDNHLLGQAQNLLGYLARLRGAGETALRHLEAGAAFYQKSGNLYGKALIHNNMANAYFTLSNWPEAERYYRMAQQSFEKIGAAYDRAMAENNLGQLALYRNEPETALMLYQRALTTFQQGGTSLYVQGVVEMNIGATYVKLGDTERADRHLQTAVTYFSQAGVGDFLPELHRHRALMYLGERQLATALQEAETAVSLAQESGMAGEEGIALRVVGQIHLAQGELMLADAALEKSLVILAKTDDQYELEQTQAVLAALRAANG